MAFPHSNGHPDYDSGRHGRRRQQLVLNDFRAQEANILVAEAPSEQDVGVVPDEAEDPVMAALSPPLP